MKKQLLATGIALGLAVTAQATLYNYTYDIADTAITDGSPVGITTSATTAGLVAANGGTVIGNVAVTLNISGGYNGDLYGYLVFQSNDGSTTTSILLNRVGRGESGLSSFGYSTSGMNVTLTGDTTQGYQNIHSVATPGSGPYLADGRTTDPNGNFSGSSSTAGLDIMNGHNANGTWTLFLADMVSGGQGTLLSWGLDVTVVPEPATWALLVFGGVVVGLVVFQQRAQVRRLAGRINAWMDAV